MTGTGYQIVFMTAANPEQADRMAAALIEERLAACVNIVGACRSIYRWKGEVTRDNEVLMIAKTRRSDFDAIVRKVSELHSYEVPEIVAVDLESLSEGYEQFLGDVLGGARGRSAIALITDFGRDSFYVGAMKGAILAVDRSAAIVDITHHVRPYAIDEASFILSAVYELWAEGTVFLAVVDPGVGGERLDLAVRSKERWILCPDNGLISDVAAREGVDEVFALSEEAVGGIRKHSACGRTFLGRDVFGPVAAFLGSGGDISHVGKRIEGYHRISVPSVEVRDEYIRGRGRHVDDFGNILTNISGEDVERAFPSVSLAGIRVSINGPVAVDGIKRCFSEEAPGELIVVLDSWNLIEISVNRGRAVDRFSDRQPIVVELTRI
jgi:hypothetical protein